MSASRRCLPVALVSRQKPTDPKVSPEGKIHELKMADSRAPGLAGLRAFRVAGFRSLWVAGLGAFWVAGLRVESVVVLIGIRTGHGRWRA